MHHNDVQYWRYLLALPQGHPDLPSQRVCKLLDDLFRGWRNKPLWLEEGGVGHLFLNRDDLSLLQQEELADLPIPIRKARAIRRMLEIITDPTVAEKAGSCVVQPHELILGTLPPFSVGQGKEFVRYLNPEEELEAMLNFLNELSPMGHIVPDHGRVVERGLEALIRDCEEKSEKADKRGKIFLQAVSESLEAVIFYADRVALQAERKISTLASDDPCRKTLAAAAARLRKVPAQRAETFIDAVQAIYLVHCALHWTVEIVPLGRLDQILQPFYEHDIREGRLTRAQAQEVLDCFWIKLDEKAILNRRHLEHRFTACDGVLTGYFGASNYDQGGLLNQWMQQITIGGVCPTNDQEQTDACNDVTRMCLECARRLPLNSPTLDLRVHPQTPDDVLELAARALLSGGAHPVLLHDNKIIEGLREAGNGSVPLEAARNYACDGCYETMFAGESEFSFGFIWAPEAIEKTLNRGAKFFGAGPINLRGMKDSWRSMPASEIEDWPAFWSIMRKHLLLSCHRYITSLLTFYGNKADVAPSPLLSALIGGCIESARDIAEGGAKYHVFSPLLIGISTAADSLYAIKTLVFEQKQIGIDELVTALASNWGENLIVQNGQSLPVLGPAVSKERIQQIRALCSDVPKFGLGHADVDRLAWQLINEFCDCVKEAWQSDLQLRRYKTMKKRYDHEAHPFHILLAPGVGTFEQYILGGFLLGASADGRLSGEGIASDLSPSPVHSDVLPPGELIDLPHPRIGNLGDSFRSYADRSMHRLGDGAPVDYNIPEDFPLEKLAAYLKAFAQGDGGSIATFTVADPQTFLEAQQRPEDFNLVRVRMGGWSEFFVSLFPNHQEQHRRRPLFVG
jgi:pyruvate-formate lyase